MTLGMQDEELLSLIKQENGLAFDQLYKKYWKRLYTYAYKVFQDEHTCEDVVQDVFIKLWKNARDSDIHNLEGYLFRAVKYQIANQIRNIKWSSVHDKILYEMAGELYTDSVIQAKELKEVLDKTIDGLPDKCKEVFRLSREESLSNKEIAEKLNISVRTVETHIYQALKVLKKNLPDTAIIFILLRSIT